MPHDRDAAFRLLVAAAKADGELAAVEAETLRELAEELQVAPARSAAIIADTPGGIPDLEAWGADERQTLFGTVCRVVVADRRFGEAEQELVSRLGRGLGLDDLGIARMLAQALSGPR